MNRTNIEEQLSRKLGNRSIEPSAGSWERVAFRRQETGKKRKRSFLPGLAAAMLALGIGILYLFLKSETSTPATAPQPVVESHTAIPSLGEEKIVKPAPAPATAVTALRQKQEQLPPKEVPVPGLPATTPQPTPTAQPAVEDGLIRIKSEQIAAELERRINARLPVTDAVVDSLLLKAQREIAMERLQETAGTTDANALLKEAEAEVDRSFRENTLNLFKNKFRTIRIALH